LQHGIGLIISDPSLPRPGPESESSPTGHSEFVHCHGAVSESSDSEITAE